MVQKGEFIQGMGRAVPKETPRQMLGELEAERDEERAEEAEEARRRQYVESDRTYFMDEAMEYFHEDLYRDASSYDENGWKNLLSVVQQHVGNARRGLIPEVARSMGADAIKFVLSETSDLRTDFFDLRGRMRALNSIAVLCDVDVLEQEQALVGFSSVHPIHRLHEALKYPAAAFARQHRRDPNGPERHGYGIVSDIDIDTVAGHVSHVGILRAAVADLPLERQKSTIRELIEGLLPKDAEGLGFFPSESVLYDLSVIRKAFPFAKAEIIARGKGEYLSGPDFTDRFDEAGLPQVVASIGRARAFAEECGITVGWKVIAHRFVRELTIDLGWTEEDGFESRMRMVQGVVGALWEHLPKAILAECLSARDFILRHSKRLTLSERLATFALATGLHWVPGTPWPNREDVQALYGDIIRQSNGSFNPWVWKAIDEIEAATGLDRWSFLSEPYRELLERFLGSDVSVPDAKEKLGARLCEDLRGEKFIPVTTILLMRCALGPGLFDSLGPDEAGKRQIVLRLLGLNAEPSAYWENYTQNSAIALGAELWARVTVPSETIRAAIEDNDKFVFAAVNMGGSVNNGLAPVVRSVIAACDIDRLRMSAYVLLAAFARKDGLNFAPPTREQFVEAVQLSLVGQLIPLLETPVLSNVLRDAPWNAIEAHHLHSLATDHRAELQAVWDLDREAHRTGIVGLIMRLIQAQAPVKNAQHDPWSTELPKLFRAIRHHDAASVDGLVSFVETFGMIGTERLCSLYVGMHRAKTFEEIEETERYDYESYLGEIGMVLSDEPTPKVRPAATPRGVCQELKKFVVAMPGRLMRGESVPGLDSTLGQELFATLVGETRWRNGDSVGGLQRMLDEDVRNHPEHASVPAAFRRTELLVREARRADETDEEGRKARLAKFLASREVEERFVTLAASWNVGLDGPLNERQVLAARAEVLEELNGIADILDATLSADEQAFAKLLERTASEQERASLIRRREAAMTERGRAGLKRQAEQIRWLAGDLAGRDSLTTVDLIDWLAAHGSDLPSTPERLRELSAREMSAIMPEGMVDSLEWMAGALFDPIIPNPSAITLGLIEDVATVQRQYVREHYLNPAQKPEHTGHPPFSRTTLRALERAWHLSETRNRTLPIEETLAKGKRIESPLGDESEETVSVQMIPVAGLLRVYAGEIGDACYSSRHAELANGTYPKLNAWVYATVDDKERMTLRGSALALGLKSTAGDRVLVLRANNPKETFARSLDAASFVTATLREAIATARREWQDADAEERKWPRVVAFPLDRASMSSTNRPSIALDYFRRFYANPRLELKRTPEATFNGYDLTQPFGNSPCVEVWRIDADGQETWTGNWE